MRVGNERYYNPAVKPSIKHDIATFLTTLGINGPQKGNAKQLYDWALHLCPNHAGAITGLANMAAEAKQFDEADRLFKRAFKLAPSDPDAMVNMSAISQRCGRLEESLELADKALAMEPESIRALRQKVATLRDLESYAESQEVIAAGLKVAPGDLTLTQWRAFNHFQVGEWQQGWASWEMRESRTTFIMALQPPAPPEWNGCDPKGKRILVISEHGIGDKIMFARWVPLLVERGAIVTVGTPPGLTRLFQMALPECKVDTNPPPYAFDYWVGMISLPLRLGVPDPPPPLDMPIIRLSEWRQAPLRVGICWHGADTTPVETRRPRDLELWRPLLFANRQFAQFRSLQLGEQGFPELEPLGPVSDLYDTAIKMADLDLVITADVSICHLAASMSIPTWMLLYRPPEWRWGVGGETTPWYPTMRIFSQEKRGEWAPVFARVCTALTDILAQQHPIAELAQAWKAGRQERETVEA